jgi:hypothetical protein
MFAHADPCLALGVSESDLGTKIAGLAVQETHPGLGNAYRKIGKVIQTTGDYHAAQGTAEATTLSDPLGYASSDAFVVKETLTNRHILLRELTQAQQATRSKLSAADRLKASSSVKRDKVDEAISALDEARSHESYLQQKTQRVTSNLLVEKRKWSTSSARSNTSAAHLPHSNKSAPTYAPSTPLAVSLVSAAKRTHKSGAHPWLLRKALKVMRGAV